MGECLSRGSSPTSTQETSNKSTGGKLPSSSHSSSTMSSGENPVVVSARGKHTGTLIFLHGLGDTGHGWASSLAEIRSDNMRIVCPTAPTIPVTLNSGARMPAWFDLISLDPQGAEDEPGIKKSAKEVEKLITGEISSGIPAERIVIGGFSQGGALALYTGLSTTHKLAGIVVLSSWFPLHKTMQSVVRNLDVPVLHCHGDCDPLVPYKWGQMTSTLLKRVLERHEFKTYQGVGHSSCPEEMDDVQAFLNERLK